MNTLPAVSMQGIGRLGNPPKLGIVPAGKVGVPFSAGLVDGLVVVDVIPDVGVLAVGVVKVVVVLLVPDVGDVQLKAGVAGTPVAPGVVPVVGGVSVGDVAA